MNYHDIIAVRNRMANLGVPHFGWGGGVGGLSIPGVAPISLPNLNLPPVQIDSNTLHTIATNLGVAKPGQVGGPINYSQTAVTGQPSLGKTAMDSPAGKQLGNAVAKAGSDIGKAVTPGAGGGGLAGAVAAPNGFVAQTPDINRFGYNTPLTQGQNSWNTGQGDLGNVFGQQLNLANGAGQTLGNQQNLYGQQQGLAQALLAQSQGQGPNPAQLQFQQNADQNLRQQAGAINSIKGLNPALAAKMISEQGAQAGQQNAQNSGILQAEQQLAAQGQLGNQYNALDQNLMGQNNTLANQGNLYAGAGNTAGNITSQGGSMFANAAGANNNQNTGINDASLGAQKLNEDVAKQNAAAKNALAMGALGGIGAAGMQMANPFLSGLMGGAGGAAGAGAAGGAAAPIVTAGESIAPIAAVAAHGGQIGGDVDTRQIDTRAMSLAHALMAMGGQVPGAPRFAGDNPKNDVVPTVLSKGEVVLPNSVTQAADAPQKAAEFVEKLKGESHPTYARVLQARNRLKLAQEAHARCGGGYA